MVSMFGYVMSFPQEFYGIVDKGLFFTTLENYQANVDIINMPLIVYLILLVLNVLIVIRLGNLEELESKSLQSVAVYNTLLTIMLIIGQIVFFIMIPDRINGFVKDFFVYVEMPLRDIEVQNVINVNYIIAVIYICYNIVVAVKNIPEKAIEFDEELYEEEFFEQLESTEEVETTKE